MLQKQHRVLDTTMMVRFEFIEDLIPLILDADEHWWPNNLVALATVSPSWLFYVRRRLYHCPTVQTFAAAKLLAESVMENPELGSLIHGISLRPEGTRNCRPTSAELRAVRFLLNIDGLKRVTLGGELAVGAEKFLRLIGSQDTIEELFIDGSLLSCRLTSRPSLEWDESFTYTFPSLKKLLITHVELDIVPSSTPYLYPSSISHLILDNTYLMGGDIVDLLSGATSLQCFHLTTSDPISSDSQLQLLLASCTIDCLHYETQKGTNVNNFPALDSISESRADSVRCLHLNGQLVDMGVLITVSEVFRNLVELVVSGRAVRVSAQEWAGFIRSGALSSLRRLGLPWGTNMPPYVAWLSSEGDEIRDACSSRKDPLLLY